LDQPLKLCSNYVYFVYSGEFVGYSDLPAQSSEQQDKQKQLKQNLALVQSRRMSPKTQKSKVINSEKMGLLTNNSSILQGYQSADSQEFELLRYGRGQIFGEVITTIKHEMLK